jgi:hypothetical protein
VWEHIQAPANIQTEAYAKYLDDLPRELAATKGAVCVAANGAEDFSVFVRQNLDVGPSESKRRATVCSNLLTRANDYKQFHDRVLDAIGETDRMSILPGSVSRSGQINLSSLSESIRKSDTIIVLCFDQEWDWAFDVILQLRQVTSTEDQKTRLLIVGSHYQAERGDINVSNFRFQTFKALEVDDATFKKALKNKIDSRYTEVFNE